MVVTRTSIRFYKSVLIFKFNWRKPLLTCCGQIMLCLKQPLLTCCGQIMLCPKQPLLTCCGQIILRPKQLLLTCCGQIILCPKQPLLTCCIWIGLRPAYPFILIWKYSCPFGNKLENIFLLYWKKFHGIVLFYINFIPNDCNL